MGLGSPKAPEQPQRREFGQPCDACAALAAWAWAAPKHLSSPSGVSLGSPVMPTQP